MRSSIAPAIAAMAWLLAGPALADDPAGTWQTEKTDDGRYLHVKVHPCEADAALTCGTIVGAFGGADAGNIGKPIIWDMVARRTGNWDDGKIWKADEDEVYDSQMRLEAGVLKVSGCVLFGQICKSQTWTRVE